MKILNVEQNTPEWLEARKERVGASEVVTLMTGTDREIYDLWLEKKGLKTKYKTSAMQRGSDMESEARRWFENESGMTFERPTGVHDEYDFLLASFDGLNFEMGLSLEIKCSSEIPDDITTSSKWKMYYWQVQAQLAVGGHDKAVLLAYSPAKQSYATIERNDADIAKLIQQAAWFHNLLVTDTPPEYLEKRDDADALEFAKATKTLKVHKDAAKEVYDDFEEEWKILKDGGTFIANDVSFECDGVRLLKIVPKPVIDYKAAFEAHCPNVDLTPYTKPSKVQWRLSVV